MFFVGGWLGAVGNGFLHEGKSVIVAPFLRPQLQKNADFCNCWAFFEQTITDEERRLLFFLFFEGENNKETGIYVIFGPIFLEK